MAARGSVVYIADGLRHQVLRYDVKTRRLAVFAGTGRTIGRVGFLPSDVEPVAGALLITQTEPVPAVRRLAAGSRTLTTLLR
jgi:hypothetical protein